MIDPSKKLVYAVESVADIAYNGGAKPVRSREIADRQGLPHRYLEQVMQRLVRAGLLRGVRGPRGGYILARERRRITLGEIARVVSDIENLDRRGSSGDKSDLASEVLRPMWDEVRDEMMTRLDQITIEDLCKQATGRNITRASETKLDYTI